MRSLKLAGLSFLMALLCSCTLFAGTQRVFSLAETPAQTAKASLLLHNAIGNQIAVFVENPATSDASKESLQRLYRRTVCSEAEVNVPMRTEECGEGPAYRADAAIAGFEAVQNAQTEAELTDAMDDLVPLLVDLASLLNGG